jgi:EmrB/QacA subfamily drug resistance transporter
LIFSVMAVALLMVSVDQTIVATALRTIQQDLNAPLTWSGWTITAYSLGQIIAMPLAGKLSDQIGRKKVLLVAVGVFTTASLCCGFAPNIYVLVALRALQALGGGAFLPSATGLVADHFRRDRDRAMGAFISIFPIGGILGPILGGIIVTYWPWRTIFLINVPIGLLLLVLAGKLIASDTRRRAARIDVLGIALLAATLLSAMYGLTNLGAGRGALGDPLFGVPIAVAIVAGTLLIRHTRTHRAPFIPARLLLGKGFASMNAINIMFGGAVLGFGALVPLYAQERYHLDPLSSGTLLTARGVGMIVVSGIALLLLRRLSHRVPIVVGYVVLAAGLAMTAFPPPPQVSPYAWLALATGISGLGMGIALPAANNAGLQLAPEQLASIAGLRGMFRQSGAIIAISITTAIVTASAVTATAQASAFLAFAGLLLLAVPLVFRVPNHRGRW